MKKLFNKLSDNNQDLLLTGLILIIPLVIGFFLIGLSVFIWGKIL